MSVLIKIACKGAATMPHDKLTSFQGNLKDLSKDNYAKLRKEILELGFSEPISVWKNNGHNYVLNGHQRLRVISQMVKEGVQCPPLPVNWVEAKSKGEAKRKVLALTSQYGNMTDQGLYEFMSEAEIDYKTILESFNFPEIDMEQFMVEYFDKNFEPGGVADQQKLDEKKPVVCPKCGHEFTS